MTPAARQPGREPVAVTGLGIKCPAGLSPEQAFDVVCEGRGVAREVPRLCAAGTTVRFAALVPAFDATGYAPLRDLRKQDHKTVLALCAAIDAVRDAELAFGPDTTRCAVVAGTGAGGLSTMESSVLAYAPEPAAIPVYMVPMIMPSSPAAQISLYFRLNGPSLTVSTACASGSSAVAAGVDLIRAGQADVVLAGGVDAAASPLVMEAFARMGALSRRNDDPAGASRPFDPGRDGFVMGEGAAFVVLEAMSRAKARGARIYGELAGHAANSDAFHVVAPRRDGEFAGRCMRAAIADAGLVPGDLGQISAHGTGTQLNDRVEAAAIREVFGAATPPVAANKGVLGHLLGGAGAAELVLSVLASVRGVVPPVANLTSRTEAGIDLVIGEPRKVDKAPVLTNSFGFGGHNACLVFVPA